MMVMEGTCPTTIQKIKDDADKPVMWKTEDDMLINSQGNTVGKIVVELLQATLKVLP